MFWYDKYHWSLVRQVKVSTWNSKENIYLDHWTKKKCLTSYYVMMDGSPAYIIYPIFQTSNPKYFLGKHQSTFMIIVKSAFQGCSMRNCIFFCKKIFAGDQHGNFSLCNIWWVWRDTYIKSSNYNYCIIVKEHDLNKKKALANETGNRSWSFKIKWS